MPEAQKGAAADVDMVGKPEPKVSTRAQIKEKNAHRKTGLSNKEAKLKKHQKKGTKTKKTSTRRGGAKKRAAS
eukprot:CAMPEP_0204269432 /NCGR_PEP_ID=MMETSP0468-20130131/16125_1 /ASSEMBLY_ACC=CAM_ASM_000383 /TAXON_ID=2969 /ORGANISM="Oxyrrhis marina" /LENGTH=72 /DNA_ID=CAMNT_0051244817 /DNA_START=26 /DNA_END=244 /DNA_ORIENTATION=+